MLCDIRNMNVNKKRAIQFFLVGTLILLGAVNLGIEWYDDDKSRTWPKTSGRIIKIEEDCNLRGKGVDYEFTVAGEAIIGHRIAFLDTFIPKSVNRSKWVKGKYSVGQEVTVYYNQNNPHNSSLLVGADTMLIGGVFIFFFISINLFAGGLFFFWKFKSEKNPNIHITTG